MPTEIHGNENIHGANAIAIIGSIASIVGFMVLMFQMASTKYAIPEQFLVWRVSLSLIALSLAAWTSFLLFFKIKEYQAKIAYPPRLFFLMFRAISFYLTAMAVSLDGFFAALFWKPWLWVVWRPIVNIFVRH